MEFAQGSGNVFADLDLPDAQERLAKARLAYRIERLIEEAGMTQSDAATKMGLTPTDVADIVRGKLREYTRDSLLHCLNALDQDVEIIVRPKSVTASRAHILVTQV